MSEILSVTSMIMDDFSQKNLHPSRSRDGDSIDQFNLIKAWLFYP